MPLPTARITSLLLMLVALPLLSLGTTNALSPIWWAGQPDPRRPHPDCPAVRPRPGAAAAGAARARDPRAKPRVR